MSNQFCTYYDSNYVSRGLLMIDSIFAFMPDAVVHVLCFDESSEIITKRIHPRCNVIKLADLEVFDIELYKCKDNRKLVEYYFTCTPCLPFYILEKYKFINSITYLDADLFFYESPEKVLELIDNYSIAIIPHNFTNKLKDRSAFGNFNVGWITWRNDINGLQCLRDYRKQCVDWCYDKLEDERFADQKYLDSWPKKYNGVYIINHKGVNLALWNVEQYKLSTNNNKIYIDSDELLFVHYHGLKKTNGVYLVNYHEYNIIDYIHIDNLIFKLYLDKLHNYDLFLQESFNLNAANIRNPQQSANNILYSNDTINSLKNLLLIYYNNKSSAIIENIHLERLKLVSLLFKLDESFLPNILNNVFSGLLNDVVKLNIQEFKLNKYDEEVVNFCLSKLNSAEVEAKYIIVLILYRMAYKFSNLPDITSIPNWFHQTYVDYIFQNPEIFCALGDVEKYTKHIRKYFIQIHNYIYNGLMVEEIKSKLAVLFLFKCNIVQLYFSEDNLKDLMIIRTDISKYALKAIGHNLEFEANFTLAENKKINIGIYTPDLNLRSETYVTIPYLYLNRDEFNIYLIVVKTSDNLILNECISGKVDKVVILPDRILDQVNLLRSLNLDILLYSTNLCAVNNSSYLLSLHRIARLQIANYCSPVTTGNSNIDYFLVGSYKNLNSLSNKFSENIVQLNGSPGCFDYSFNVSNVNPDNTKFDVFPKDKVIFISTVNFYKITPELISIWCNILSSNLDFVLVLHPFNPNWNSVYPELVFKDHLYNYISKYNIAKERIIISTTNYKSRDEVLNFISTGDVYLDAIPYSGSVSITDVLTVSLPLVVFEGINLRSTQAAALLNDIDMTELITESVEEYIKLAIKLGNDLNYRIQIKNKISKAMREQPEFYNCKSFSLKISRLFKTLHNDYIAKNKISYSRL